MRRTTGRRTTGIVRRRCGGRGRAPVVATGRPHVRAPATAAPANISRNTVTRGQAVRSGAARGPQRTRSPAAVPFRVRRRELRYRIMEATGLSTF